MYSHLNSKTNSYGAHAIDDDDINAVLEVLKGSHLTCGQFVNQFENDLATLVNSKHAVSTSNGTTALHLASLAAGVSDGDCVIVPTITFLATANAPSFCGADVIFCDVNQSNGLATKEALQAAIDRSPKKPVAFYPVDIAGQPSSNLEIRNLCDQYGIKIIQDSSHALGTTFESEGIEHTVGDNSFSDFTTFSFHAVKNITTGEGGAITTNDKDSYRLMKALCSHGMTKDPDIFINREKAFSNKEHPNPWYYEMQQIGYNYRLTDIQAALGVSQLKKLNHIKKVRQNLKSIYDDLLAGYVPLIKPVTTVRNASPFWHLYTVLIDFSAVKINRADVMNSLAQNGIGTQVHYIPVHSQPYYKTMNPTLQLEGADSYYEHTLSLPLHAHLTEADIQKVVDTLLRVLKLK